MDNITLELIYIDESKVALMYITRMRITSKPVVTEIDITILDKPITTREMLPNLLRNSIHIFIKLEP